MPAVYVLILIPILFYIVIPIVGAFRVRAIWRRFRQTMINASLFPICGYDDTISRKREGYFRFFGEIEAIQQNGLLWVKNDEMTMTVKMQHCHVYMIPSEKKMNSQMPTKLPWSRVFSIAEGTAVFISGEVKVDEGRAQFSGMKKDPLTVIIYDGENKTLLERCISCGRQKNEYWNFLTPWSIAIGGILSLALLSMMIQANVSAEILTAGIIVSALPVIPFLPPGILFFFIYTGLWRRGRYCRSDRDLVALPLRFEDRNIRDREYRHIRFSAGEPLFPVDPGYKIRSIHFPRSAKRSLWHHSLFGAMVERHDGFWVTGPRDPMKEFLLIEDDPRTLVDRATQKAVFYEVLSMVSISASLFLNIWLMVEIIRMI